VQTNRTAEVIAILGADGFIIDIDTGQFFMRILVFKVSIKY
jgi:hypothetical protein